MNRPLWATVTGVLGILFAVVGLLGAAQMVFFPRWLDAQKGIMESPVPAPEPSGSQVASSKGERRPTDENWERVAKQIFDVPAWFKPLSPVSGLVELFVAGFYLFASIQFLSMKRRGLRWFQWALGLSTFFHLMRGTAAIASLSILGLALVGASIFWVVVNTVLFLTVRFNDQRAFQGE